MPEKHHNESEKLYASLLHHIDDAAARDIAFGVPLPPDASDAQTGRWVRHICARLEETFDEATIRAVRRRCYCTAGMAECGEWIKKLYDESSGMEDFVARMNALDADWRYEDGCLYTTYGSCSCPMLAGIDSLPGKTWCYCTLGYGKKLLEDIFQREVEIELLDCIKMGCEKCVVKVAFVDDKDRE